ncbi:MAG: 30S ribosomal protein S16 [bacterium]
MVKIRLTRLGARNNPTYRVVAIDSRRARDSQYLEALGHYDPRRKVLRLNLERVDYWLSKGAQPSNTVDRLIKGYRKSVPAGDARQKPCPTNGEPDSITQTESAN